MNICWDQSQKLVGFTLYKEVNRIFDRRVICETTSPLSQIDILFQAIDKGPQGKISLGVSKLKICGPRFDVITFKLFRVWGEKLGKKDASDVIDQQDNAPDDRQAIFAKFPPNQAPIALADLLFF